MALLYLVSYLDRVNVSYAALTMNADIGLSAAAYGAGAGVFFIGYVLFEIPSNLMLHRVGARVWIARIIISWGILSTCMAFVTGPTSFFILRFLLGMAEAGFFPGMVLYLTYWFPAARRARIMAAFLLAVPLSSVFGAPISTTLLQTSIFGFAGWQTMFIVEGVPAVMLGVITYFYLTDRPAEAGWLSDEEKAVIIQSLEDDEQAAGENHISGLGPSLRSGKVWTLGLIYFGIVTGLYGFGFWGPQIVQGMGVSSLTNIGLIMAVPYAFGAIAMWLWGKRSDRTGERFWHVAAPALLGCCGFALSAATDNTILQMFALGLAVVGIHASLPVFWTLPTQMLRGTAAAGGIALVNSIGNLSGYVGPYLIGLATQSSGGFSLGLLILSVAMGGAAILAVFLSHISSVQQSQSHQGRK